MESSAAQVIISIIPIVGIVMGSVVIFFYLLWAHRRKTLLIKAGLYKKPEIDLFSFSLLTGLLLASVGVASTVLLILIEGRSYGLLGGLIPLSMGAGLLGYHFIKRRDRSLSARTDKITGSAVPDNNNG